MFKYKTYLNFKCKTFKFEQGLNILIPTTYVNSEALINEMLNYFNSTSALNRNNCMFMYTHSPDDILQTWDLPDDLNNYDNFICLIDGQHVDFKFMSAAQKLNFRMRLNELSKKHSNLYILFVTDDYAHLSHNRCIDIDNSRTARTFKSYSAYTKFLLRGNDDVTVTLS